MFDEDMAAMHEQAIAVAKLTVDASEVVLDYFLQKESLMEKNAKFAKAMLDKFMAQGFSREEAMVLTAQYVGKVNGK